MSILKSILPRTTSAATQARVDDLQAQCAAAAQAEADARAAYQVIVDQARDEDGEVDLAALRKAKSKVAEAAEKVASLADIAAAATAKHEQIKAAEAQERLVARWQRIVELSDKRVAIAEAYSRAAAEVSKQHKILAAVTEELQQFQPMPSQSGHDPAVLFGDRFNRATHEELCRQGIMSTITNPTGYNLKSIVSVFSEAAAVIRARRNEVVGARA